MIPKKMHAIWIGSLLDEKGRKNLENWVAANPDYKMNIWIDSSLYPKNAEHDAQFDKFKIWAEVHNVIIRDLHGNDKKIYQGMLSRDFYDLEILGERHTFNLAAASDILRTEILYREGGVYFDAKDIYPAKKLGKLKYDKKIGFLCHVVSESKEDNFNNDILASTPKGPLITQFRDQLHSQYKSLFEEETPGKLLSHRDPNYMSPKSFPGGDSRFLSTLQISGPDLLQSSIEGFAMGNNIDLSPSGIWFDKVKFPQECYSSPEGHALSWTTRADPKKVLRNYVAIYFTAQIDNLLHSNGLDVESVQNLKNLRARLNSFSLDVSLIDIIQPEQKNFSELEEKGNPVTELLNTLIKCANSLETKLFPILGTYDPQIVLNQFVYKVTTMEQDRQPLGELSLRTFIDVILMNPDSIKNFLNPSVVSKSGLGFFQSEAPPLPSAASPSPPQDAAAKNIKKI